MKKIDDLIRDPRQLNNSHIPKHILLRKREKREILHHLRLLRNHITPFTLLLHGPSGTGKTALVRHLVNRESFLSGAGKAIYINCWRKCSLHSILDALLPELGTCCTIQDVNTKISRLDEVLKKKNTLLIFDEWDKLDQTTKERLMYNILEAGTGGVILISNSKFALSGLDSRVDSRANMKSIKFRKYRPSEICKILKHRARLGLSRGIWTETLLKHIASNSGGDARIAIQALKYSAAEMVRMNRKKIDKEMVVKGLNEVRDLQKKYLLSRLTKHHGVIYNIVRNNPDIISSHLLRKYGQTARRKGMQPIARRTFSKYVDELIRNGLITYERTRSKGRSRLFQTC